MDTGSDEVSNCLRCENCTTHFDGFYLGYVCKIRKRMCEESDICSDFKERQELLKEVMK